MSFSLNSVKSYCIAITWSVIFLCYS